MSEKSAFIAGAASGFVVRLITQPLDVIKIRFQLQVEPISNQFKDSYYKNIIQASKRIYMEEGILGFWKGHIPAQYLSVVFGAVQFETFEKLYAKTGVTRNSWNDTLFGGVAGSTASLFCQPIDVIRTRLVSQGLNKKYNGFSNAVILMGKEEGLYGFFRGLVPSVIMIFPQTAIQFFLYHRLKRFLSYGTRDPHDKNHMTFVESLISFLSREPYNQLLSGSIAGIIGKFSIYPLDLAKRRLQVQGFEEARICFGRFHRSTQFIHSIRKTIIEEGFLSIYKGIIPSSIKSGVVSSLTFYFFETFSKIL